MAKSGKGTVPTKEGRVIRLSKKDCDAILKALEELKHPGKAGTVAKATADVGAALASPKVFKLIKDVHSALCMSSTPGKVVVIDVD